jgi:CheY-like chemotaxis protein
MANSDSRQPLHTDQSVILVVDDDVMVQNIVRISLESDGYFVLTAHDGQEALDVSRGYDGPIHLLLTDFAMPGMNGLELCRRIRQARPETQVLLMSGDPPPSTSVPLLEKPFTMGQLLESVQTLIPRPVLFRP